MCVYVSLRHTGVCIYGKSDPPQLASCEPSIPLPLRNTKRSHQAGSPASATPPQPRRSNRFELEHFLSKSPAKWCVQGEEPLLAEGKQPRWKRTFKASVWLHSERNLFELLDKKKLLRLRLHFKNAKSEDGKTTRPHGKPPLWVSPVATRMERLGDLRLPELLRARLQEPRMERLQVKPKHSPAKQARSAVFFEARNEHGGGLPKAFGGELFFASLVCI